MNSSEITPKRMLTAMARISHFDTIEAALAFRLAQGGWIFTDGVNHIWFDISHTPSTIFGHRATSGLSGQLI